MLTTPVYLAPILRAISLLPLNVSLNAIDKTNLLSCLFVGLYEG